jgi:hypothetical protein
LTQLPTRHGGKTGVAVLLFVSTFGSAVAGTLPGAPQPGEGSSRAAKIIQVHNRGLNVKGEIVFPYPSRDIQRVTLSGAAVDASAAADLGYSSMSAIVDVRCAPPMDKVLRMEVFDQAQSPGSRLIRSTPGEWAKPSDGSLMGDVVREACSAAPTPQSSPVSSSLRSRGVIPPPGVLETNDSSSRRTAKFTVQLGAFSNETAARARLAALGPAPAGLRGAVTRRVIGNAVFFRAVMGNFATELEAREFCRNLRVGAAACWVRLAD